MPAIVCEGYAVMNRALTASVFSLTFFAACDSIDVGRPEDPPGAPTVEGIFVQDETRIAFRAVVTDILLADEPLQTCSQTDPCPAELGAADPSAPDFCTYPETEMSKPELERVGTCPDPLHPSINPPFVGEPGPLPRNYDGPNTGNQIRIVFNKLLQGDIDAALRAGGQTIVKLSDASGDLPVLAYYDSTGVILRTALPFLEPAGPAIVLKPLSSLNASTRYTITVDGAQVKSKDGNAAGAIGPYDFTTEAAFPLNGTAPEGLEAGDPVEITNTDALSFFFQAAVVTATTVITSSSAVQKDGMGVLVAIFVDGTCEGSTTQLNVVPTSSTGEVIEWEEGDYTFDLSGVATAAGPDHGAVAADPFGSPLSGAFTVTSTDAEGANPISGLTLPTDCE